MENLIITAVSALVVLVALGVVGLALSKVYVKASKERAFVRTGAGSEKVVLTGGALVMPFLHEIIWVNMNTLRLEVRRDKNQSLITKDRMRVDAAVEFYVRVANTKEAVAIAAQTLGERTLDPRVMKEQVESKFVDALRSVAAKMTMAELHEKRADFVQAVQQAVASDLERNGLELESASLTSLDQTKREWFDESNAFDAEGLTALTRETETRRRERNDIERDTAVAIQRKNLEATEHELNIRRQQEEATLNNEREVAAMRASQQAEVAQTESEGRRRAEQARIQADQEIATRNAEKDRAVSTAELQARAAIDIEAQNTSIAVANKSQEEAAARAKADLARAAAVRAEEEVASVRAKAIAEREKDIKLIQAQERAQEGSIAQVVAAQAEQEAAAARAEAIRVAAEGARDAALLESEAIRARGEAEAEAIRKRNEAQNTLTPEIIRMNVQLEVVRALPALVEASVRPMEKIDSIRIAEVGGLGMGGGASGGTGGHDGQAGLSEQVVNAAMRYRANAPLIDGLLGEVGLGKGDVASLVAGAGSMLLGAGESQDAGVAAVTAAESAREAALPRRSKVREQKDA